MSTSKLRAAILVLLVGFLLGVGIFAASRLSLRAALSADAAAAAEEVAARLALGGEIDPSRFRAVILRYTTVGTDGRIGGMETLNTGAEPRPAVGEAVVRRAAEAARSGRATVEHPPLFKDTLGLSPPGVLGAAAPVVVDGETTGAVFVEVDQSSQIALLGRSFQVLAVICSASAVLAFAILALASGRGVPHRRRGRGFNPQTAVRDPLTGLLTRQEFGEALSDAVERASEEDHAVGLLIVDLDGFADANNIWGHAAGDAVVKQAAGRLAAFAGPASLARIGGDHFALIVERDADSHALRQLGEKIRTALGADYRVGGSTISIGTSMGAALYPVNADTADKLFRAADGALLKAKADGRDRLAFFDTEMKKRIERRATLEGDLRQALERDEFVVFYQPQRDLASGRLIGHEALVRWERPGEGILSPRDFLPVAEETGLIRPIGDWVLRKACEDAASWLGEGTVSVNFCAAQFRHQEIDKTIAKVLKETGLPPARLEIEVPESLVLERTPAVMEVLERIKALGVRVAMDDFGSSYSALASLAAFPFDKIKVDRSFVSQLSEDPNAAGIVASIVGLGRSLSPDVAAQGVETNEQVTLFKAAGCGIVQGFLFGAPARGAAAQVPEAAPQEFDPDAAQGRLAL